MPAGVATREFGDQPVAPEFTGVLTLSGSWHSRDHVDDPLSDRAIEVQFDGRLDNRRSLCRRFQLRESSPDVDLVAESYRRTGSDAFAHFVGDFAFALLDRQHRRLFLARDPFGTRPMFWSVTPGGVAWSSDAGLLARSINARVRLTDDYVAGFLTGTEDPVLTPFQGIAAVAPGGVVAFEDDRVFTHAVWRPQPGRITRFADDRDYEVAFVELLCDAIRDRMCRAGYVFAELSGGLDSSSIVSAVALLVRTGEIEPGRLTTVTYTYPDAPTSKEKRYWSTVTAMTGFPSLEIAERDVIGPLFGGVQTALPNPLVVFEATYSDLAKAARARGANTVLSGHGGDHVMMHAARRAPRLADYVTKGRLRLLASELRGFAELWKLAYAELLWGSVVWPMLPDTLKPRFGGTRAQLPSMFESRFVRRSGLQQRWVMCHGGGGYDTYDGRWQCDLVTEAIATASACHHRELLGADLTYPYLHRPLVEYLLSIPSTQKLRPTEMRSIQRRALASILPDQVRSRTSKAGIGEVTARGLVRHWHAVSTLAADMHLYDMGYLDRRAFVNELTLAKHGVTSFTQPLTRALVLEAWLRAGEPLASRTRGVVGVPEERR